MGIGTGEIILILVVFLLLFGAKRLPDLAKSIGKSLREFKKAASDIQEELHDVNSKTKNDSANSENPTDKPAAKD
ncbi:MAG: twin-arginine translocase TatA/TatE family subunit [Candidatus Marinimicrobia bacterium]|nr:twin-arginine translocase TatA/TatE family subunit [Candidatus Neomarinimicrobiota bacterium]MDD5540351.1 twin-arginine translocase TatA/TatE family subunit [Candidatus Neomarinimicrobiota bacterium]